MVETVAAKIDVDASGVESATRSAGEALQDLREKTDQTGASLKENIPQFKDLGEAALSMGKSINEGKGTLEAIVDVAPAVIVALSEMTLGVAAVAVGVMALGTALYVRITNLAEMRQKVEDVSAHMTLMGRAADGNKDTISRWGNDLHDQFGLSGKAALDMVATVTQAIPQASTALQHMATDYAGTIAYMGKITDGKEQARIAGGLAQALSGDFSSIRQLSKEFDLLSASQLDALDKAEREHDQDAASLIMQDALSARFRKVRQDLEELAAAKARIGHTANAHDEMQAQAERRAAEDKLDKDVRIDTRPDQGALKAREEQQNLVQQTKAAAEERRQLWVGSNADFLADEVKTWRDVIAQATAGSQARADAERMLATIQAQLRRETHTERIGQLQAEVAAAGDNMERRAALVRQIADETVAYEAKGSAAAIAAQSQATQAARAAADARLQMKIDAIRREEAVQKGNLDAELRDEQRVLDVIKEAGRQNTAEYETQARRVAELQKQMANQRVDVDIAGLHRQLQAALQNEAERDRLLAQLSEKQRERYAGDSAALDKALTADRAIVSKFLAEQEQQQLSVLKEKQQQDQKDSEQRRLYLNLSLKEVAQSKVVEVELERQATLSKIEEWRKQEEAYAKTDEEKTALAQRVNKQIVDANRVAASRNLEITRQLKRDQQKEWQETISGITKSMGSMAQGLITGTKTARQAATEMAQGVLSQLMELAEKQATAWITKNLLIQQSDEETAMASKLQSLATSQTQVQDAAVVGAANAYASASAGPEWWIAPAISAAVQLAIAGLASGLSSAAGGWGRVPADGMLTELHKDEMVLPASIAAPLRTMLAAQKLPSMAVPAFAAANLNLPGGGAANANGPFSAGGGGGNVTLTVQAMDSRDVASFFNRHGDKLVSALRGQKRNFSF
ncbi:hypothetical protein [Azospirillum sp. B4]|uniref:hypothetical protein n=1 Tax=Azospirillum sp. B4 TaxID=95605 RepID=UPI00034802FC|nr:hypothetical protein [Azospirillum sp. B4]